MPSCAPAEPVALPRLSKTLAEARDLITETDAHCRDAVVHEVSAEIAGLLGDAATHDRELRTAHRRYVEMGASAHATRLRREIAS